MAEEKVLYKGGMWKFEGAALVYETPMVAALVALAAAAFIWFRYFYLPFHEIPADFNVYVWAVLSAAWLFYLFYSLSYYPRKVTVFPDGLRFDMLFSHRVVKSDKIEYMRAIDEKRAASTLFNPYYRSLTPSLGGAVLIKFKSGRPWVFSPEDPEAFLAAASTFAEILPPAVSEDARPEPGGESAD